MKAQPTLPGYEILTCLGGGMLTSVYAARAIDTDQPVAIKMLRPDWRDQPVAVKLLQREARACLAVSHENLVRLVDQHVLTPPHFLVLEMLAGESLRRRLRREYHLDVATALWITRQTAEALAALQRKGFVHGDVKPDNIRLVGDGKAVLLDLGFAHRPGENASLLEAGYILGTVDYLAPELCGAEPQDDPRSDVFGLGVTLFEILSGRLPYPTGSVLETLRRHRGELPADIRDFVPQLPRGLPELIDAMLDPYPENRPQPGALVQELISVEIAALRQRSVA